jgi:hypothetical protein
LKHAARKIRPQISGLLDAGWDGRRWHGISSFDPSVREKAQDWLLTMMVIRQTQYGSHWCRLRWTRWFMTSQLTTTVRSRNFAQTVDLPQRLPRTNGARTGCASGLQQLTPMVRLPNWSESGMSVVILTVAITWQHALIQRILPSTSKEAQQSARLEDLLIENGFDPIAHEQLREDLRSGRLGMSQNRLPATVTIEDVARPKKFIEARRDIPKSAI